MGCGRYFSTLPAGRCVIETRRVVRSTSMLTGGTGSAAISGAGRETKNLCYPAAHWVHSPEALRLQDRGGERGVTRGQRQHLLQRRLHPRGREHIPDGAIDLIVTDLPMHRRRPAAGTTTGMRRSSSRAIGFPQPGWEFSRRWIMRPNGYSGGGSSTSCQATPTSTTYSALRRTAARINHIMGQRFSVSTPAGVNLLPLCILFYEKPGGKRTFNLESR